MSPTHPKFATFLTAHREKQGLTQPQLAEKVGVTKSNVYYWESGTYLPQMNVLERLARALKVSYEDLLLKGRYPRHEVGLASYLRRRGLPEEGIAEAEQFFSKLDDKYAKRRTPKQGRRR